MRKTLLIIAALVTAPAFAGDNYVRPHVRNDGTYVEGHYRSNPDSSRLNNYSTQGNYNPYNGQQGTQSPYPAYNNSPSYPSIPAYPSTNNNGLYQRR